MEPVRGVPVIRRADDEGEFFYVRLQGPHKLHETLWHRDELAKLYDAIGDVLLATTRCRACGGPGPMALQNALKKERKNG